MTQDAISPLSRVAAFAAAGAIATVPAGGHRVIRVPLHAVNASGQSGLAILTPTQSGFTVVIRIAGRRIQAGEHDHIHNVTCARYARIAPKTYAPTGDQTNRQLSTVAIGLTDIYRGRSKTAVASSLSAVTSGGFSINVHEPGAPYTALACGDIPRTKR